MGGGHWGPHFSLGAAAPMPPPPRRTASGHNFIILLIDLHNSFSGTLYSKLAIDKRV